MANYKFKISLLGGCKMVKYTFKLSSDNGVVIVKTYIDSYDIDLAIKRVLDNQKCPERAIIGIEIKEVESVDEGKQRYLEAKEKTRQEAIDWQLDFDNHNYSWGELAYYSNHFEKLGKRYGLLKEFKENGIC